jgi:hypothetical protein
MPIADLAVIVPSRGRPEQLARLIAAVHATARGRTHVLAGVDQDDPRLKDYIELRRGPSRLRQGDYIHTSDQRRNLVEWTNCLERRERGNYRFLASLGDDMVPKTIGWDVKLMAAIDGEFGGTGIAYPWTATRDDIPEAYVISADLPVALGWMMLPSLQHFWNDNVWADLGHGAGCIRQLRGVVVEHLNVGLGRAEVDQTARDNGARIAPDQAAYQAWCRDPGGRAADILKVKELKGGNHGYQDDDAEDGAVLG